jgi:hypothetical protein
MQRLHSVLNFLLYLICQIAGTLSFAKCNCTLAERMLIGFLFSYMITDFFISNRKIIREHYTEQVNQNQHI